MAFQQIEGRFFQSACHFVQVESELTAFHLDLDGSQLLQTHKCLLQGTPSGPAAHPDINHMPIPVFFG